MQSDFVRDLKNQDQPIYDAIAERPGKPLRLRVHPQILRGSGVDGLYRTWKDVRWTIQCDTPEEAFACRDAMRVFFDALERLGAATVMHALQAMQAIQDPADTSATKGGRV